MLIVPAIATLFSYLYWRPHELSDLFRALTINTSMGFVGFTYLLDLRRGATRLRGSPLLGLISAFTVWCVFTLAVKAPDHLSEQFAGFATSFLVFLFVSEGLQDLRALNVIGRLLLAFTCAFALLGVLQGLAPTSCYVLSEPGNADSVAERFDGRPCVTRADCTEGGTPGAEYVCEHPGLLGTRSVGGRVRYRGLLQDPNEMAWVLSMGLPFAFAFYESKRSRLRLVMTIAAVVLCGTCVVMTKSRSGQLSMLAIFAVYFARRFGRRGIVAALVMCLPLIVLGGRSGAEAESSSEERLGCMLEALRMWRDNPLTGVGAMQFTEHHYLTAHNSFMLTLAELGPVGFLLWTTAVYFAIKVTVRIQTELAGHPEAEAARSWSLALLASLTGLVMSAAFLSIAYHPILWIFLGLSGGLYAAVRLHQPGFRVKLGGRDLALVCAIDTTYVSAIAIYIHLKGV